MDYIVKEMQERKHVALIAHDNMKASLIEWCEENREILKNHHCCGTGTTSTLISEKTGLFVQAYNSGPLGGDQQIGSKIVGGDIDIVIFFSDPLSAQPHDPDVKALLRIAQVYDIPMANTRATADFIIHSEFFNSVYFHKVVDYQKKMRDRVKSYSEEEGK